MGNMEDYGNKVQFFKGPDDGPVPNKTFDKLNENISALEEERNKIDQQIKRLKESKESIKNIHMLFDGSSFSSISAAIYNYRSGLGQVDELRMDGVSYSMNTIQVAWDDFSNMSIWLKQRRHLFNTPEFMSNINDRLDYYPFADCKIKGGTRTFREAIFACFASDDRVVIFKDLPVTPK